MSNLKHKPYERLKEALHNRNVSYRELGDLLSISVTAVCNKINGKSDFLISETDRIEAAYLIPRSVFLPDEFR